MKSIVTKILASLVTAGILTTFSMFYRINERLARIETKIEMIDTQRLAHK